MNRFSRICLLVIAVSLIVIALRPIVKPQPVVAAGQYKYLAVTTTTVAIQTELDRHVAEGWELAAVVFRTATWRHIEFSEVLKINRSANHPVLPAD